MNRKLKAKIVERYDSQFNFSKALRVDEAVVSRIVTGRRTLDSEQQREWCNLLRCDPNDLFQELKGER